MRVLPCFALLFLLFMKFIGLNPCSVAQRGRLEEISSRFASADIILLAGAWFRSRMGLRHEFFFYSKHMCVHSWYIQAAFTNRSAGVSVLLRKGFMNKSHIANISLPDKMLVGGLAVQVKSNLIDIKFTSH